MKVFVTGGTGTIGNVVARAFRRAGHEVTALCRTGAGATSLWREEIRPVIGDLDAPDSFAEFAREAEIVVHAASSRDRRHAGAFDRRAAELFLDWTNASGLRRTYVHTSGVWVYGSTGAERATEALPVQPLSIVSWRPEVETLVMNAGNERISTVIIRPGCVYGGRGGLTGHWFETAEREGSAKFVGEGDNRWAMVHLEDLADLYVLAVRHPSRAEIFNATDRSRSAVREMAAAASRAVSATGTFRSVPFEEAAERMGRPFAEAMAVDQDVDSSKAAQLLGWHPRFGGFVDDAEIYYRAWKHSRST